MENKTLFSEILERQSDLLERIRHAAHEAHAAVNQFYGVDLPYSYHWTVWRNWWPVMEARYARGRKMFRP